MRSSNASVTTSEWLRALLLCCLTSNALCSQVACSISRLCLRGSRESGEDSCEWGDGQESDCEKGTGCQSACRERESHSGGGGDEKEYENEKKNNDNDNNDCDCDALDLIDQIIVALTW